MADFLSPAWFATLNTILDESGPVPLEDASDSFLVVIELTDGPDAAPQALRFIVNDARARVEAGEVGEANAAIRLSFADAEALTNGTLESAGALREGRMKVRGDVHTLVPLLGWLVQAHERWLAAQ